MNPGDDPVERRRLRDVATTAVAAVLGTPAGCVTGAASLLDLPGFDSVAVVAVLDRLEEALHVEVPADLIVPEAFESLDTLTQLLRRTLDGSATATTRAHTGGGR